MLNQHLHLKLSQKLSPQQVQLMKLIQLPLQELEQRLAREIEENPSLELGKENEEDSFENSEDYDTDNDINVEDYLSDDDVPDYKLKSNNHSQDDDEKSIPFASGISFNQFLKTQLNTFSFNEIETKIAEFLVGSIDQSGYLRRELLDIVDDLAFTMSINTDVNVVKTILKTIHLLDPPGVGAQNLQECLILQLKRKLSTKSISNAINILENNFDLFIKKHYEKIITKLNMN
jgi:RNA polymerase sigma-54 factor